MRWLVAVACVFGIVGRGRADDWLAALPECAGEQGAAQAAELLYPREGLPALVNAGELLVVRARLSLPLTPPPGVQQERALEGFEAELVGHARVLGDRALVQRMPLEVVNVRPEGPSSLRYRVALPVPAWTAPGTYDLVLRAKGASLRADSSVRVLAVGAAPRLARLLDGRPLGQIAGLLAPVDVFLDERAASGRDASLPDASSADASLPDANGAVVQQLNAAAPPRLRTSGLHAALRVGDALWVIGGCEAPHLPFEVEVESVLRAERRVRVARVDAQPAPLRPNTPDRGFAADYLIPITNGWELRAAGAPFELSLLVAAGAGADGWRAEQGTLRFHPAGDVGRAPDALIARWSIPVDRARLVRVKAAPLHAALRLLPAPVPSDEPVRASVRADRALAAVALRFDHRHTAYALQPVEHRYRALGRHAVHGLAIGADGSAVMLKAEAQVVIARAARGLGCGTAPGTTVQPIWAGPGLWLAVRLLKRRGPRRAGNRLGAEPRSA